MYSCISIMFTHAYNLHIVYIYIYSYRWNYVNVFLQALELSQDDACGFDIHCSWYATASPCSSLSRSFPVANERFCQHIVMGLCAKYVIFTGLDVHDCSTDEVYIDVHIWWRIFICCLKALKTSCTIIAYCAVGTLGGTILHPCFAQTKSCKSCKFQFICSHMKQIRSYFKARRSGVWWRAPMSWVAEGCRRYLDSIKI